MENLENLPFKFDEYEGEHKGDDHVWIPECEFIGNLCTNDLEGAAEETLLVYSRSHTSDARIR
jgi:hypothetical protein